VLGVEVERLRIRAASPLDFSFIIGHFSFVIWEVFAALLFGVLAGNIGSKIEAFDAKARSSQRKTKHHRVGLISLLFIARAIMPKLAGDLGTRRLTTPNTLIPTP
jgi:uncharacterized membrane protein